MSRSSRVSGDSQWANSSRSRSFFGVPADSLLRRDVEPRPLFRNEGGEDEASDALEAFESIIDDFFAFEAAAERSVAAAAFRRGDSRGSRLAREELGLGLISLSTTPHGRRGGRADPGGGSKLGNGVAGAYLVRRDQPFVFLNGKQAVQRQRFTLAHELGHHRLRHAAVVDGVERLKGRATIPSSSRRTLSPASFSHRSPR